VGPAALPLLLRPTLAPWTLWLCLRGVLRYRHANVSPSPMVYLRPSAINSPRIASTRGMRSISPPSMRPTLSRTSISPCHNSHAPLELNAPAVKGLLGGFHLLRLKGHMVTASPAPIWILQHYPQWSCWRRLQMLRWRTLWWKIHSPFRPD